MWQDYVLTATEVFFCITLIPLLLAKEKPPVSSSIMTGGALLVSAAIFFTLHLWIAGASQTVVGLQWFWLAVQKIRRSRDSSSPR